MPIINVDTNFGNITIPASAYNIRIRCEGSNGGGGGSDSGGPGGSGGSGRGGTFSLPDYQPISLTGYGSNAGTSGGGCFNRARAGGSGAARGGDGGAGTGCSGSGGGGGGCSAVYDNTNNRWMIVAGGGGGGGGGAWDRPGGSASSAGGFGGLGSPQNGGGGGSPQTENRFFPGTFSPCGDGSGGGGGGAGSGGGSGGTGGCDFTANSTGGGGGGSGYRSPAVLLSQGAANGGFSNITYTDLPSTIISFEVTPNSTLQGIPQTTATIRADIEGTRYSLVSDDPNWTDIVNQSFPAPYTDSGFLRLEYFNVLLPQSEAGVNSPATATYTLTVYSGPNDSTAVTQTIVVSIQNDNTPTTIIDPTNAFGRQTAIVSDLNELEERTDYYVIITWDGTDMPCRCAPAVGGLSLGLNTTNFTVGTVTIPTEQRTVYAAFTSEPFNPSRVESSGGLGQYTSKTYTLSIGSVSYSFTARTRRPDLTEIFDMEGQPQSPQELPNPDIDTLATPDPLPFINTNSITLNDAEIPVEVKASLPDVQVRVNGTGGWSDVRQIGTP